MRGLRVSATVRLVGRRREWSERDRRADCRLTVAARAHVNTEKTGTGIETSARGRMTEKVERNWTDSFRFVAAIA